jgi:hypothetical protein
MVLKALKEKEKQRTTSAAAQKGAGRSARKAVASD